MKLRTKKIEVWIYIDENYNISEKKPKGDYGKVLITPLNPEEINDLYNECMNYTWENEQRIPDPNYLYNYRISKIKKIIQEWNFKDKKDKFIECTNENKIIIFLNNPEVIDNVLIYSDKVARAIQKNKDFEEKNLEAVQNGTAKKDK